MKLIKSLYRKMNIRKKIIISFSLISIITSIIILGVSYIRDSNILKNNIQEMATRDAYILRMDIEKFIGLDSDTYMRSISHSLIIDILSKDLDKYDSFEKVELVKQLNNSITELEGNRITRIRAYIDDDKLMFADYRNFFPISTIEKEPWYSELIDTPDKILWSTPHYPDYFSSQMVITANYTLTNPINFTRPICVISVDISEKGIRELLERRRSSNKHHIAIIDDDFQVISTSNYGNSFTPDFFSRIPSTDKWNIIECDNDQYMTLSIPINKTPWQLLYIISLNTALEPIAQTRDFLIILSFIMVVFLIIVSTIMSHGITKRIITLHNAVMTISDGNIKAVNIQADGYCDEISGLQISFNRMVAQLDALIDERFNMAINLKNAEIRALQAQINPHFLYNTLDIISWRAIRQNNQGIYKLVNNLANYYKMSLNHGKDLVTLADELMHIKYYVNIQNERFNNKIILDIDIDGYFLDLQLPKLTLQPIVENSIIHGLLEKEDPGGTIFITASREDKDYSIINIIDDGVGIPPDKLSRIFYDQQDNMPRNGYGLNNVRCRLNLSVGGDVIIESLLGSGATTTILLPNKNS